MSLHVHEIYIFPWTRAVNKQQLCCTLHNTLQAPKHCGKQPMELSKNYIIKILFRISLYNVVLKLNKETCAWCFYKKITLKTNKNRIRTRIREKAWFIANIFVALTRTKWKLDYNTPKILKKKKKTHSGLCLRVNHFDGQCSTLFLIVVNSGFEQVINIHDNVCSWWSI